MEDEDDDGGSSESEERGRIAAKEFQDVYNFFLA